MLPFLKNYYIFPDYNAAKGIETVQLSYVDFEYWKGCETGRAPCPPLTFTCDSKADHWYLWMPCGGTSTYVTLTASGSNTILQETSIEGIECPPVFNLTHMPNGTYTAYMMACGLGGSITIHLQTKQVPTHR